VVPPGGPSLSPRVVQQRLGLRSGEARLRPAAPSGYRAPSSDPGKAIHCADFRPKERAKSDERREGPRFESASTAGMAWVWRSWDGGVTLWSDLGNYPKGADTQSSRVGAGERRIVSVLVSDIQRSTPIAEQLGPERYKLLFDEVTRLMRQEVERLGGTVAQLTGDGMLGHGNSDPKGTNTIRPGIACPWRLNA
jgi:hypothetical protein